MQRWVVGWVIGSMALVACGAPQPTRQAPGPRSAPTGGSDDAVAVASSGPDRDDEEPESMPMAAAVPTVGGALTCTRPDPDGPFRVSQAAYDKRAGKDAQTVGDLQTDRANPLEACGVSAAHDALAALSCADGSSPFGGDASKAASARRERAGAGGRCGALIETYDVSCATGTVTVHVDTRFCGPETDWK